jgi:uncharacterized protein (UPF0276 family)
LGVDPLMQRLGVGFALHPDLEYLQLTREIVERDADYYEVNPETMWRRRGGRLERNDFHALFLRFLGASRKPFVAHGLEFSLGTPLDEEGEPARVAAWLERLRDDHAAFGFAWMSEHLGWTTARGLQATLPLPLPHHPEAVAVVAERMRLLKSVVPTALFENWATTFVLDDPVREPEFFNSIARGADCGFLLDLHNAWTQSVNFGFDAWEYVSRLELDRVVQIHVSGGSMSDPTLLASRRSMRLDSHDAPVPEDVWRLLERILPRCRNVRGVVVERLNGTFGAAEVPGLAGEVRRAKELFPC